MDPSDDNMVIDNAPNVDEEDKEENITSRILRSEACRQLFTWRIQDEGTEEQIRERSEEQRHRWNFDFLTETPLPGRFQWVRCGSPNGHLRNGNGQPDHKRLRVDEATTPGTRSSAQYRRTDKRLSASSSSLSSADDPARGDAAESRDTTLNRSRRSSLRRYNTAPFF